MTRKKLLLHFAALLSVLPCCCVLGQPPVFFNVGKGEKPSGQARYHYFVSPSGGKIYCKISNEKEKTIRIGPHLTGMRGMDMFVVDDDNYWGNKRVQGVKGDITLPSKVEVRLCRELYDEDTPVGTYTIVGIDAYAFKGCKELASITLPNTVSDVKKNAFEGCSNLTVINLSSTLTDIDLSFATGCDKLEAVNKGRGVQSNLYSIDGLLCDDGEIVFCPVGYSQDVTVPSSVKAVGEGAFANHANLLSVTVPPGVHIKSGAFKNCTGLSRVSLSNGVSGIDTEAFLNCTALEQITIPGSVKFLGGEAFRGCLSLSVVTFGQGVETIGNSAFADCISLREVDIPPGLESIYSNAFANCSGIERVSFGEGLRWIGQEAFLFCSGLKELTFPQSLNAIYEKAFMGCSELRKVVFNPQIKEIERYAFFGCSSLTTANLPKQAKIYDETFLGCDNLKHP